MADTKISALAATTTVGDTDEYVVAVSGASKKITGANLKAGTLQDYKPGGTDVAVADGGTGSSTASGARTNLGLVIDADVAAKSTFDAHLSDATDAHDASAISVADAGGYFAAAEVEAALQELGSGAVPVVLNPQTASYPLVLTDAGKLVGINNASANDLTIPTNASVAFPVGTMILIRQVGAGITTVVAAGGVTLHSRGGLVALAGQYAYATLVKVASDTWDLSGDIA